MEMPTSAFAAVIFACLVAAVLLGRAMSRWLPEHHLSSDTRDTIKLSLGLVATLAALLLGLLVSSAKGSFDEQRDQVNALAAKIATLDRVLELYGAESAAARGELRFVMTKAIAQAWPARDEARSDLTPDARSGEAIFRAIQQLQPVDATQSDLKEKATSTAFDLVEGRSRMIAQAAAGIPVPLLAIVICWLFVILFGFSLLAPRNPVALSALIVSAAAICGAMLLLLELYGPFDGAIQISSDPLLAALGDRAN
jgi:hypothetical protein